MKFIDLLLLYVHNSYFFADCVVRQDTNSCGSGGGGNLCGALSLVHPSVHSIVFLCGRRKEEASIVEADKVTTLAIEL